MRLGDRVHAFLDRLLPAGERLLDAGAPLLEVGEELVLEALELLRDVLVGPSLEVGEPLLQALHLGADRRRHLLGLALLVLPPLVERPDVRVEILVQPAAHLLHDGAEVALQLLNVDVHLVQPVEAVANVPLEVEEPLFRALQHGGFQIACGRIELLQERGPVFFQPCPRLRFRRLDIVEQAAHRTEALLDLLAAARRRLAHPLDLLRKDAVALLDELRRLGLPDLEVGAHLAIQRLRVAVHACQLLLQGLAGRGELGLRLPRVAFDLLLEPFERLVLERPAALGRAVEPLLVVALDGRQVSLETVEHAGEVLFQRGDAALGALERLGELALEPSALLLARSRQRSDPRVQVDDELAVRLARRLRDLLGEPLEVLLQLLLHRVLARLQARDVRGEIADLRFRLAHRLGDHGHARRRIGCDFGRDFVELRAVRPGRLIQDRRDASLQAVQPRRNRLEPQADAVDELRLVVDPAQVLVDAARHVRQVLQGGLVLLYLRLRARDPVDPGVELRLDRLDLLEDLLAGLEVHLELDRDVLDFGRLLVDELGQLRAHHVRITPDLVERPVALVELPVEQKDEDRDGRSYNQSEKRDWHLPLPRIATMTTSVADARGKVNETRPAEAHRRPARMRRAARIARP